MTLHFMSQNLSYRGDGMKDDTKQKQEIKAKRTAKNSVFLDLFQNKSYLLKLYKTLYFGGGFERIPGIYCALRRFRVYCSWRVRSGGASLDKPAQLFF